MKVLLINYHLNPAVLRRHFIDTRFPFTPLLETYYD